MVTLTGWLLEYPVIYVLDDENVSMDLELDEWQPRSNSLGGVPLTVIRVWACGLAASDYLILSFSYPSDLHDSQHMLLPGNMMEKRLEEAKKDKKWTFILQHVLIKTSTETVTLDRVALWNKGGGTHKMAWEGWLTDWLTLYRSNFFFCVRWRIPYQKRKRYIQYSIRHIRDHSIGKTARAYNAKHTEGKGECWASKISEVGVALGNSRQCVLGDHRRNRQRSLNPPEFDSW